ncbi:MAG: ATP-dependent DNA helicase RecG [Clostridia bacterium]|nr:ATP-dependent DNA helicase RecG [Clostridia bacterium]
MKLSDSVGCLAGVGKVRQGYLEKLGIYTIKDLLYHFPRAYQNKKDVKTLKEALDFGENCAMILTVGSYPKNVVLPGNKILTKFTAYDESGKITVSFFNQAYIKEAIKLGEAYRFWGRITRKNSTYFLSSPDFEPYKEDCFLPDYSPVYSLTNGITQKIMFMLVGLALMNVSDFEDPIPESIRREKGLMTLREAMVSIHRPENYDMLDRARKRFVFEELYIYALCINFSKNKSILSKGLPMNKVDISPLLSSFKFELTPAQKRSVNEIYSDMVKSDKPMTRLLSGDVGSGKTACAECAAYIALKNGYQVCIMAPTEILASQHYNEMKKIFDPLGFNTALLTGSLSQAQKNKIRKDIKDGVARLIVGTHALITDETIFKDLGLVITDEQHRFGVSQRSKLGQKSKGVHTLVMTATPIPRSLALIIYGELSLSIIDTMPEGRIPIETYIVTESRRNGLYGFMEQEIRKGRQIYVVCPSIEERSEDERGEVLDATFKPGDRFQRKLKSAVQYASMLQGVFPNFRIGLVHGKMKAKEKADVMKAFSEGSIDVLVSTTVIEVGVNVPNASVMVVENAECYGLAALHQLRGRVGRGRNKSYCFLVSDVADKSSAKERLTVLKNSNNGYEIAEYDLKQRGPGEYFSNDGGSIKQSGEFGFSLASMCEDLDTLADIFSTACAVLQDDSDLLKDENRASLEYMSRIFSYKNNIIN